MKQYRSKPVIIQAMQFNAYDDDVLREIDRRVRNATELLPIKAVKDKIKRYGGYPVPLKQGSIRVKHGEYIIKDKFNYFIVMSQEDFERIYEEVDE